jgi:hypothetical protein
VKVNTTNSVLKTKLLFDQIFGVNVIVFKHDYHLNLDNLLYYFCAIHKVLFVNVPYIIYRQFYLNNSWARRLESGYNKKSLKDEDSKNIYYNYNPIHFDENDVYQLIKEYIDENSKENADNDNIILLCGYVNNDLLQAEDICFNLPLYEIRKLTLLGNYYF